MMLAKVRQAVPGILWQAVQLQHTCLQCRSGVKSCLQALDTLHSPFQTCTRLWMTSRHRVRLPLDGPSTVASAYSSGSASLPRSLRNQNHKYAVHRHAGQCRMVAAILQAAP